MKVFISQPMRGKTDEQILDEREALISNAKRRYGDDAEIIDSFFQDAPHDANPVWFLGKSLEKLSTADVAYFAKGWEDARGCRIEHQVCLDYNITIVECYNY